MVVAHASISFSHLWGHGKLPIGGKTVAAARTPTHCRDISRRTFIFVSQVRATPRAAHPPPYETVQTYEAEAQRPLRRPEDGTSRPSGTTILGPDVERRRGGNLMIGYPGPMSQPQAPSSPLPVPTVDQADTQQQQVAS